MSFVFLAIFSCNPQPRMEEGKRNFEHVDRIEYRFSDSSTPPQYHRSYSLVATSDRVNCMVDVYGTTLADETYPITSIQFEDLKKKSSGLERTAEKIEDGATGTKTHYITLFEGDSSVYSLIWDSLNEVDQSTKNFVTDVKNLVPELPSLLEKPLPEK